MLQSKLRVFLSLNPTNALTAEPVRTKAGTVMLSLHPLLTICPIYDDVVKDELMVRLTDLITQLRVGSSLLIVSLFLLQFRLQY
jgi:hypothetical protein